MENELKKALESELGRRSRAYVRNLAAAEQATLHGQFNVAKILRAAAQSQRIMAMEAARLLSRDDSFDAQEELRSILQETSSDKPPSVPESAGASVLKRLRQSAEARSKLREIIQRSISSLQDNPDVLESDVAQYCVTAKTLSGRMVWRRNRRAHVGDRQTLRTTGSGIAYGAGGRIANANGAVETA